jgi:hypothetical protein
VKKKELERSTIFFEKSRLCPTGTSPRVSVSVVVPTPGLTGLSAFAVLASGAGGAGQEVAAAIGT